ncbi:hypothetical protein CO614_06530 [Lysobacteraceae bacterium NML120232]|nr:hypothetical protein CO608_03455 [Xanthomonadaceae bacterium NML08-0793]PJK11972.1 hypothetical protein CO614_06530 [Xanthomonadaceae bacterium NML120232]
MKTSALLLALAALSASPTLLAQTRCNQQGSQQEMNACAHDALQAADAELNQVWREVRQRHRDNPMFAKLQQAQRLWIQMRDAELEAMFPIKPGENRYLEYGSMYPMLHDLAKAKLTRERTEHLRRHYLDENP